MDAQNPSGKTRTLPENLRGTWLDDPDVVTALRVFDTAMQFELPRATRTFKLGSASDCDVRIAGSYLSALHCVLERRGQTLRVHDQSSKNGTFFDGRRESVFDLRPGSTFTAASLRFLALNDVMNEALPTIADILGAEDEHAPSASATTTISPSEFVVLATSGAHVLITGEAGSDQARLAQTLHSISLLRGRPALEIDRVPDTDRTRQREILDQASRSTLIVHIDAKSPMMDGTFLSMLFSRSYQIRVVAVAPFAEKAKDVLGAANVETMSRVAVRPLVERGGAVLRLLDRMLVQAGASLRAADLSSENRKALQMYSWPHNIEELRLAAERFAVIARAPSGRQAAEALQLGSSTFHRWTTALGINLPLTREETR